MTLEESATDPLVDGHSNHLSQCKYTVFLIIKLLGLVNSLEEESSEGLKGVLVHMVDDVELDEQEVKHGALRRYASVDFTHNVDGLLGLGGFELLLLDFHGSSLGHFEGLNQGDILQDSIGVSVGEVLQQFGFELSELVLETVLTVNKLFLGLLEVGLFNTHDHSKKLVFKTGFSDNEVDDCALGGCLGLVVGVNELGLEVKFERAHNVDIFRAEFDCEATTFLNELS